MCEDIPLKLREESSRMGDQFSSESSSFEIVDASDEDDDGWYFPDDDEAVDNEAGSEHDVDVEEPVADEAVAEEDAGAMSLLSDDFVTVEEDYDGDDDASSLESSCSTDSDDSDECFSDVYKSMVELFKDVSDNEDDGRVPELTTPQSRDPELDDSSRNSVTSWLAVPCVNAKTQQEEGSEVTGKKGVSPPAPPALSMSPSSPGHPAAQLQLVSVPESPSSDATVQSFWSRFIRMRAQWAASGVGVVGTLIEELSERPTPDPPPGAEDPDSGDPRFLNSLEGGDYDEEGGDCYDEDDDDDNYWNDSDDDDFLACAGLANNKDASRREREVVFIDE